MEVQKEICMDMVSKSFTIKKITELIMKFLICEILKIVMLIIHTNLMLADNDLQYNREQN